MGVAATTFPLWHTPSGTQVCSVTPATGLTLQSCSVVPPPTFYCFTSGTVEAVLRLRLVCVGVLHQRWHPLGASAPHRLRLTLACSVTPVCSVTAGSYNTG